MVLNTFGVADSDMSDNHPRILEILFFGVAIWGRDQNDPHLPEKFKFKGTERVWFILARILFAIHIIAAIGTCAYPNIVKS
jgi:hypothetical protein